MNNIVNLSQLVDISRYSKEFSHLADEYIFSHFSSSSDLPPFSSGPVKIDGLSWMLCYEGNIKLNVNLESFSVHKNMLLLTNPESIIEIKDVGSGAVDFYTLFISREFMRDINLDVNILSTIPRPKDGHRIPCFEISPEDAVLFRHYFELLHHNTTRNRDDIYVRSIARCIIAALCYQLIQSARDKADAENTEEVSTGTRSKRNTYVDDFISLLHVHHRSQRSVSFYASKLFISPKYLSLVIKKATGKSAAELIDEFVILEAKNLLRFSGKNIQQVAYELNFPNQSSFGKYFKHLTGMSPSEYQRK